MRNDDAGIHTVRDDCDRRARASARRAACARGAQACWEKADAQWAQSHQAFLAFKWLAQTATWDEGLDGVYPRNARQKA